jgi:hypothetical protein
MARNYQLLIVLATIAAMILLIGCGQPTATGTTGLSTATPAPSPRATNAPTRTDNTGQVTLHIDAPSYRTYDSISVTLNTQSNQTISFPDHLTNCSVILLLRLPVQPLSDDNGQMAINPCRLEIVTRMHSLGAGQSLVVKLIPPSNGWLPGLYHATLSYSTSLKKPTPIYTAAFPVGPITPQP